MIRQSISCDLCGTEMLSANHWFIAREHGTELRIGIWTGQVRLGPSVRHLCGYKCLHKFVDDFVARKAQSGPLANTEKTNRETPARRTDTSLLSAASFSAPRLPVIGSCAVDPESSARLLPLPQPFVERMPAQRLHAEAWKREMAREHQQQLLARRSIARSAFSVINALIQPAREDS